eukprot:jgi/Galph1/2631/GphlegSOOS_G1306.1
MQLLTLGACREVGKSCFILKTTAGSVMLDCGLHPSHYDQERFPNLAQVLSKEFPVAVLITHCHADHVGALPILTERLGYGGPIFMSEPTRDLSAHTLEECSSLYHSFGSKCDGFFLFSKEEIEHCLSLVQLVRPQDEISLQQGRILIRCYLAGHVLGALMYSITVEDKNIIYTGDFSTASTFHLCGAQVPQLTPDILITEATYANNLKKGRIEREVELLQNIVDCLIDGGKVLIPVVAVGRAQELLLLLTMYWKRFHLKFRIFFSSRTSEETIDIYTRYKEWTRLGTQTLDNCLDFSLIQMVSPEKLLKSAQEKNVPMVALTTPGTLSGGLSLEVFRMIASEESNLVIIPSFCVSGSLEKRIESCGKDNLRQPYYTVHVNKNEMLTISCKIMNLHFGFHVDSRDLILFLTHMKPRHVVLIHGEGEKMDYLCRVIKELGMECVVPLCGQLLSFAMNNEPAATSQSIW